MTEKPNKSGAWGLSRGAAIGHESGESPAFDADSIGIRADNRSAIPPGIMPERMCTRKTRKARIRFGDTCKGIRQAREIEF